MSISVSQNPTEQQLNPPHLTLPPTLVTKEVTAVQHVGPAPSADTKASLLAN